MNPTMRWAVIDRVTKKLRFVARTRKAVRAWNKVLSTGTPTKGKVVKVLVTLA